ncbi:MAG: TniB family NTP-binding protein [Rhodospirillales bacterium]|nr:TniB family NTP-binding protein [Rhodospirillales bacterium]
MTGTEFRHLLPATQALLDTPDDMRIRRIRTDRWIGYARAEAALAAIEDMLSFPKRTRMPNLLLVGPTNNGKTMIIEKFRRSHLPGETEAARASAVQMPILKVQMPPAPDERRFFSAVLQAFGAPDRMHDRLVTKQELAVRMLRATNVRMLVIDEVHNVLSGSRDQQRRFLNLLRWLGNELQIPIVAVGTAEGLRAVQSDDQLANRFTPFALPPWTAGAEFIRLLNTLEAVLPLKKPSSLGDPQMVQKLLVASEGILGEVVTIVTRAAVLAITSGCEAVTLEMLDGIGFIPPAERRRAVG